MDPEEFANTTTDNDTDFGSELHYTPPSNVVLVPAVVVNLGSIVADVLMIYLITKFKNLHTIANWYIVSWRVCSVLFLALSPINFMVLALVSYVWKEIACVWFIEIFVAYTGNVLFVVGLTVDWYLSHFASRHVPMKIRSYYRWEIVAIWVVIAILAVSMCFRCALSELSKLGLAIRIVYIVFVLTVYVLRGFKLRTISVDGRSNLVLILVFSHVLCWLPNDVLLAIKCFDEDLHISYEISALVTLIGYSNSIVVIAILYYCDKNFQTSFKALCNNREELSNSESSYESIDLNKPGEDRLLV
ncbi:uncharacterized protein LOC135129515 [Zophobas morio]|uniref:uncharacterized protein LOC135129515 n=1 Tax=Zophobas morio TaxID=2755281 RepID=UPI0030829BEC